MDEVFWRVLWVALAATLVTYVSIIFFGSVASDPPEEKDKPIVVTDRVSVGIHRLSGIVPVSSDCDRLTVNVRDLGAFHYHVDFSSWREPSRDCPLKTAYQSFYAVVFAPALGVQFEASLDNTPLDLQIVKVYTH